MMMMIAVLSPLRLLPLLLMLGADADDDDDDKMTLADCWLVAYL